MISEASPLPLTKVFWLYTARGECGKLGVSTPVGGLGLHRSCTGVDVGLLRPFCTAWKAAPTGRVTEA